MDEIQFFRWYAPVGILPTMDDAVLRVFLNDVLHPFLDGGIALVDGLAVAILPPEHITTEGQCCGPCHIIAVVVPEGWRYVGDAAVRTLCLTDVTHPFGIETLIIKEEAFTQRSHRPVAQPRLTFVALRTVDRHSFVVVQNSPPGILHHFVQDGIRTLEMSCGLHLVSHHFRDKVVLGNSLQSDDLCKLKTVIDECRRPPTAVAFLTVTDVNIRRAGITEVFAVECAVVVQFLGINDADSIALLSSDTHLQPSCYILTDVDDVPFYGYWLYLLQDFHTRCHLGCEIGLRDVRTFGLQPFRIVIAYLAPTRHLPAGVIFLTVVFVVGADRSVGGHLPTLIIGLQTLGAAVRIFHDDIDAALGIAEGMNLIGLMLLHREITPVAQDDAETDVRCMM